MFSDRYVSRTLTGASMLAIGLLLSACDDGEIAQQQALQQQAAQQPDSAQSTTAATLDSAQQQAPVQPSAKAVETVPPEPMPHHNIHFSVGSAQLSPDAMQTLTSVVDYLRAYPVVQVKLSGYTDQLGATAANKTLAEQRVASAVQYLEERGIERSRIATDAVGEVDAGFVPSGENPATWNRRVEVEFSISPSS